MASQMGLRFYPNINDLLDIPGLHGVLVTCGTTRHAEVIIAAANKGIHVFVEKPLAFTSKDAVAIREAVKKNNIHFTMSDPVMRPEFVYIKNLADSGMLGKINCLRVRFGHDKALNGDMDCFYEKDEAGAGTLLGMGFHAAHVVIWFLGKPRTAGGIFDSFLSRGKQTGIDENSVAIFGYDDGVIGIAESTWVCPVGGGTIAVYGTNGAAFYDETGLWYKINGGGIIRVEKQFYPAGGRYPLIYWLDSIVNDTQNLEYGIDEAVALTEVLETVVESQKQAMHVEYK